MPDNAPWLDYGPQQPQQKRPNDSAPWLDYQAQQPAPAAQPKPWEEYGGESSPTMGDYASETGLAFQRGAFGSVASTLRGVGAAEPGTARRVVERSEEIQQRPPIAEEPTPEVPTGEYEQAPAARAAERTRRSVQKPGAAAKVAEEFRPIAETPVTQTGAYQLGEKLDQVTPPSKKILNPFFEDVVGGVGSTVPTIATGLIPGVGLPLSVGASIYQGMGEAAENAVKAGATEDQIYQAARLGAFPGATEFVDNLLPMLGSIGKTMTFLKRVGTRAAVGAFAEGGQEALQSLIQDAISKGIYDPNKEIDVGKAAYEGLVAAVVGSVFGGVFAGKRGEGKVPQTEATEETRTRAYEATIGGRGTQLELPFEPPAPPAKSDLDKAIKDYEGAVGKIPTSFSPLPEGSVQTAGLKVGPTTVSDALPAEAPSAPPAPPPEPGSVGAPPGAVAPGGQVPLPGPIIQDVTPDLVGSEPVQMPTFEPAQQAVTGPVRVEVANSNLWWESPNRLQGQLTELPFHEWRPAIAQFWQAHQEQMSAQFAVGEQTLSAMNPVEGVKESDHGEIEVDQNNALVDFLNPEAMPQRLPPGKGASVEVAFDREGRPYHLTTKHTAVADDWLASISADPARGEIAAAAHDVVITRLRQLVPDVPIHILSKEEFAKLAPEGRGGPVSAVYNRPLRNGKPDTAHPPFIIIREEVLRDSAFVAHDVKHELAHAATVRIIESSPTARREIGRLMHEFNRYLTDKQFAMVRYAFTEEAEFVAEAYSNVDMQYMMAQIPLSRELRAALKLEGPRPSLWQGLARTVQKLFGFGMDNKTLSILEATMRITDRISNAEAQLPSTKQQRLPYTNGLKSNQEAIRNEDPTADPSIAVGRQPEFVGVQNAMMRLWLGKKIPPQNFAALGHADRMNWFYKMLAGLDQLARSNPYFEPLIRYMGLVRKMHNEETRIQAIGIQISRRWNALGERGDRVALLVEDMAQMAYRSPAEQNAFVVRHPTRQEFDALVAKHGLTNDQEALTFYYDMKASIDWFLDQNVQSLVQKIRDRQPDPVKQAREISNLYAEVRDLQSRPYFPFTRFGRHALLVTDPSGRPISFQTFEGIKGFKTPLMQQRQAYNYAVEQFKKDHGRAPTDKEVRTIDMGRHVKPMIGQPILLLQQMSNTMGLTPEQTKSMQYLSMANGIGFNTTLAAKYQRKFYMPGHASMDVKGYSMDLKRAYSRFFFHGARFYTRSKYLKDLEDQVTLAGTHGGRKETAITEYMRDHFTNSVKDAKGDWGWARGAIFTWTLGYSPAAATQNLSQVPMIAFPFLNAKFGIRGSTRVLVKSMAEVKRMYTDKKNPPPLTNIQAKAMSYAIETGRISETQAPELAAMSQYNLLYNPGGNLAQRSYSYFMDAGAFMFETMEQWNRRITFRAGLDLALEQPNNKYIDKAVQLHKTEYNDLRAKNYSEAEARAIIAAIDVVEQTQYVYARWARPRFMRSGLASVLFVFQKYVQSTLWMFAQNKDVFWRYALIAMAIGGMKGFPGAEELSGVVNALGRWYFGRDFDVEREARQLINQVTNPDDDWADLIFHGFARKGLGIPALLDMIGNFGTGTPGRGLAAPKVVFDEKTKELRKEGFATSKLGAAWPVTDRSRALTMGHILPIDVDKSLKALTGEASDINQVLAQQLQRASGAVFSVGFNIIKAINDDHYAMTDWKRWERAAPRVIGDATSAVMAGIEGRTRVRGGPESGMTINHYDARDPEQLMELIFMGMGYQPLREQLRWNVIMAQSEAKAYWDGKRKGLLTAAYEARSGGRDEDMEAAQKAIDKFNENLPEYAEMQKITKDQMDQSFGRRSQSRQKAEQSLPTQRKDIGLYEYIQRQYPGASLDVTEPPRR